MEVHGAQHRFLANPPCHLSTVELLHSMLTQGSVYHIALHRRNLASFLVFLSLQHNMWIIIGFQRNTSIDLL